MASSSSTKKITLESQTIMDMIEDDDCADDTVIPIISKVLAMVIKYCKKHHVEAAAAFAEDDVPKEDDLEKWDAEFVKVDYVTLFQLFRAARDFSPEEEEEISKENQWDFE